MVLGNPHHAKKIRQSGRRAGTGFKSSPAPAKLCDSDYAPGPISPEGYRETTLHNMILISAPGSHRPDIVHALTGAVLDRGGNIQAPRMTVPGDDFPECREERNQDAAMAPLRR